MCTCGAVVWPSVTLELQRKRLANAMRKPNMGFPRGQWVDCPAPVEGFFLPDDGRPETVLEHGHMARQITDHTG